MGGALIVGIVFGIAIGYMLNSPKPNYPSNKRFPKKQYLPEQPIQEEQKRDPKYWLEIARGATCYEKKQLIRGGEIKVYWGLVRLCQSQNLSVHAQPSMGEYVGTPEEFTEEYSSVNSLRADFCITRKNMMPLGVVEYYGRERDKLSPERKEKTVLNDERKRIVMEKVGMFYHVVQTKHLISDAVLKQHLQEELLPKIEKALN